MARIRTVKPEAPQHRKVGKLSDRAFRLWIVMITQADDEGRLVADPDQLRILAFGYQPGTLMDDVLSALGELTESGLIRQYAHAGTPYADFPSWKDHQRINRPTPSKLPPYQDSRSPHGGLNEEAVRTHAGSEGIKEGIKDRRGGEGMQGEGNTRGPASPGPPADVSRHLGKPSTRRGGGLTPIADAFKENNHHAKEGKVTRDEKVAALAEYLGRAKPADWDELMKAVPLDRYGLDIVAEAKALALRE